MTKSLTEAEMWAKLSLVMGDDWLADRIESKVGNHVPDVTYTMSHHGWIELKVLLHNSRTGEYRTRKPMPYGQAQWLVTRDRAAGHAYVLAASRARDGAMKWWLIRGRHAPLLAEGPITPGTLVLISTAVIVGASPRGIREALRGG